MNNKLTFRDRDAILDAQDNIRRLIKCLDGRETTPIENRALRMAAESIVQLEYVLSRKEELPPQMQHDEQLRKLAGEG